MTPPIVSRGFRRTKPVSPDEHRIPPGQYLTGDWPVLSAGPTPHTDMSAWSFEVRGLVSETRRWSWEEFLALPQESFRAAIHCVTKWTKLDTIWRGVSLDTLLAGVRPQSAWVTVFSDGGYTTNLQLSDLTDGKAFVAHTFGDQPLAAEHGGPARMVVPAHYFWKSAKWIRGVQFTERDQPGFWERAGYNNVGDPWLERRYAGD